MKKPKYLLCVKVAFASFQWEGKEFHNRQEAQRYADKAGFREYQILRMEVK